MNNHVMTRKDIIALAVLLVVGIIGLAVIFFYKGYEGESVLVKVDGKVYGRYPLDVDLELKIEDEWGINVIEIRDGEARVSKADCPDKICMKTGSISRNTETIVCLPHRLVVTIEGRDDDVIR
ncbi:MAG: NusG domain II-containing protein [Lachnospiraceae bacterium]|nr:NusG domain II-containing protein [Lachnospiraceae bacterium]